MPAMHPTLFQLKAFGTPRLLPAQSRAVLAHLRSGCARCRAALAPRLIPWMDHEPADEAAATNPADCGRTLAAAYLRAAARAARAGAKPHKTPGSKGGPADKALTILNAEGPAAISHLPRPLFGIPAIEALLHQTYEMGPSDPRLRLRLAELAQDLAETTRGAEPGLQQLRCRATIELANAYRVSLDLRSAQQLLHRAEEQIARGGVHPLLKARLLVCQSLLFGDQTRPVPARAALGAAMSIYRREARREDLAKALVEDAYVFSEVLHDYGPARVRHTQALLLLDPGEDPLLICSALMGLCLTSLRTGNWREALATLRRHRRSMTIHDRGRNRARFARLEGELLGHEGDLTGAASAFAFSRRQLEAIGQPYEAGAVALVWAAVLRRHGDLDAAQALVAAATESMLRLDPHREVYVALMYLRTANRFSATRTDVPLERLVEFLSNAEFNPSIRLQPYLA
jgi:hypothetical protein